MPLAGISSLQHFPSADRNSCPWLVPVPALRLGTPLRINVCHVNEWLLVKGPRIN